MNTTKPESDDSGFAPIGGTLGDVLKEILRRVEVREQIEAELGRPVSDEEFLRIADASGLKL